MSQRPSSAAEGVWHGCSWHLGVLGVLEVSGHWANYVLLLEHTEKQSEKTKNPSPFLPLFFLLLMRHIAEANRNLASWEVGRFSLYHPSHIL